MKKASSGSVCSIRTCSKDVLALGMCGTHYKRWQNGKRGAELEAPVRLTRRRNMAYVCEDIEWILGTDTTTRICQRVGFKNKTTCYRSLRKIGRQDLVNRLILQDCETDDREMAKVQERLASGRRASGVVAERLTA